MRGQNNDFVGSNYLEFEGTKNQDLGGDQTMIIGGPKRVFVPQKQNLRDQTTLLGGTMILNLMGQNNNFGGTNDLEFEGAK